ncbi:amino acid ABC transporter substrate-binding protein [Nocardioides sp. DS6]|uniref:Amino acid ABC transporter substrate-binding protein n=1 Tax=Nocardioides eburneus TaxID=3231482 RepID=A0ABV3SSS5_9ACTN
MWHDSLRRGVTAVALAGLVGLGLVGCGQSSGASGDTIKVGTSLPLTGEFSQPGAAAKQGYEIWRQMVNADGGLLGKDVDLVVKDDASNQNTIVSDYNALISQDKVSLLLGTFSSLLNLPASAVAEKNQMLYVEPAGGSPEMFSRGFKYLFFSQQAVSDQQGIPYAEYIASLPADERPKTAAYPTLDDPFAAPVVEGARKALEKAGVKTVYKQTYAIDTKNFDTIAAAIKNVKPDLVFHGAQFEDGVGLTRAMLKAGFTPKMYFETNAPSFGEQYAKGIGAKNTEGVTFAVSYSPQAKTPGNTDFVAAFKKKYGELPAEDAADAYAAGQVLQAAVAGVGSADDQTKLADWLRGHTVQTILGPLKWDDTGAPIGSYLIGQWQGGQARIVLPEGAATAKIKPAWTPGGAQ